MSIVQFALTGRVVFVALVSCFAVGVPFVILATSYFRLKAGARDVWIYAPLAGAGLIVLISQNLVYLDVTIAISAVLIWLAAAAAWIYVLSRKTVRVMLFPLPHATLGLGLIVYFTHGVGLVQLGASSYFGYGWVDQFNYTSLAQFFGDFPFHSTAADQGFLQVAQYFKNDRIGQSVLHAFLMVSSGVDAQQSFGPTILLAPFLMFFSFLALASRFAAFSPVSCLAALAGALSPAIATIHLEGFLSQALSVPFILLWPVAVDRLIERPDWRSALIAGALLSVIAAVYTELMSIAIAIAIICAVVKGVLSLTFIRAWLPANFISAPTGSSRAILFMWIAAAVLIAFTVNFELLIRPGIFTRIASGSVFGEIYPWAYKPEGLVRLWLGNQVALPSKWIVQTIMWAMFLMIACNAIGLISYSFRSFSALTLALAMLMCVPLGPFILGKGSGYPYQFYKLLLIVWPLHVFWLVMGTKLFNEYHASLRHNASALGATMVVLCGYLVIGLTNASAKASTVASTHRGGAHLLMDPDFQSVRRYLEALHGRDVLVLWSDDDVGGGEFRTSWFNYFARDNRVRSLVPIVGSTRHKEQLTDADLVPISSAAIVSWKKIDGMEKRLIFANSLAFIYETNSQEDMKHILDQARITVSRTFVLSVDKEIDLANWYPLWVAGEPGNASLLTMKFGEFNEFRYDHWGYPAVRLKPEGNCRGKTINLKFELMLHDKRLRLTCNGNVVEVDIPLPSSRLRNSEGGRLGWNAGISSLEGKYPLAESFPGVIRDVSPN
ncbi:hypothetical protein [Tardiphaga robiniae]|uniref:Glycosyltransferase RgtA/B/C/D-like domain-containing protein n=1 Tax=Tardiphaga robiniae TaxID=943830 RepID=A0A161QXM8_9BRAD|nr:hypothetical protein [Tardiphaga robiniae]KZD20651.1 hypothetical protein A4A58_18120 [Tardiphaga robiniae]